MWTFYPNNILKGLVPYKTAPNLYQGRGNQDQQDASSSCLLYTNSETGVQHRVLLGQAKS